MRTNWLDKCGRRGILGAVSATLIVGCGTPVPLVEEAEPGLGSMVVTQWNDSTELFLEYPHVVAGIQTGNWAIHLTDVEDFQPITSGTVVVRFLQGDTEVHRFEIEEPLRDGIFIFDPVVTLPGSYQVTLALESPQVSSVHTLSEVQVFASLEAAPLEEVEDAGSEIPFLKEQQWVIPFAVTAATRREITASVSVPGEIVPADGSFVRVGAPMGGFATAAENLDAPSVGDAVRAGDVLVVLTATADGLGFLDARATVEDLEREVARAERLLAAGAIPARRLEEARHMLEVAVAELESLGGLSDGDDRLRIRAPISGVVAERTFVPGGRVMAGETLFTIVDPATAWVRLQMPPAVAGAIPIGAAAIVTLEGSEEVLQATRLISVGRVLNPTTRTVPVTFAISGGGAAWAFGQLARASVPTQETLTGVVIPNSAIVLENGLPVAYIQSGGESFLRRPLILGATDGLNSLVLSGIGPGEMVVTVGGYQVRLASLSGGEFAGGHTH